MEIQHLNQKKLAQRWQVSEATLERWRSARMGPDYLKLSGRVCYRLADVEAYELQCPRTCQQPNLVTFIT